MPSISEKTLFFELYRLLYIVISREEKKGIYIHTLRFEDEYEAKMDIYNLDRQKKVKQRDDNPRLNVFHPCIRNIL